MGGEGNSHYGEELLPTHPTHPGPLAGPQGQRLGSFWAWSLICSLHVNTEHLLYVIKDIKSVL